MADNADRAQENDERAMSRFEKRDQSTLRFRVATECVDCGDDIAPARLKIFPWALRCAECQTYYESVNRG